MILTRVFGHSAAEFQIIIGVLGMFFTSITTIFYKIGKIESELKEFKTKTINSFKKIGSDTGSIKKKLGV